MNNDRIRAFTLRSDDAHGSSIVSLKAAVAHARPAMRERGISGPIHAIGMVAGQFVTR